MKPLLLFLGMLISLFCTAQNQSDTTDENYSVFTKSERLPAFNGDYKRWVTFVDSVLANYNYYFPIHDSTSIIRDSVKIKFLISNLGKLSEYKIMVGNNLFLNRLVVDLLQCSIPWIPFYPDSYPASFYKTISIEFIVNFTEKKIKYLPSSDVFWKMNHSNKLPVAL